MLEQISALHKLHYVENLQVVLEGVVKLCQERMIELREDNFLVLDTLKPVVLDYFGFALHLHGVELLRAFFFDQENFAVTTYS